MTKKLSIAGLVVAAAASSAVVFGIAPAKAACLPSDPSATCATFDPSSASNIAEYTGFSGTYTNDTPLTRVRVLFQATGTFNLPFNITNITLFGDGLNPAGEALSDVSITSTGLEGAQGGISGFITGLNLNSQTFANSKLSFTIPSGVASAGSGATLTAFINYQNATNPTLFANTSGNNFTTTVTSGPSVATPAPISILGAGAAFGFSRRLRKQIKQVA